jgi:hypothetical protein
MMKKTKKQTSSEPAVEKMSRDELINALKESQEINEKLLDLMLLQNNKMTEITIQSLEKQIKMKHSFLADLEDSEPPKLFKSVHKDWQNKMDAIIKEIEDLDKKLYEEYAEFGKIIEHFNKKNKDND